MNKTPAQEAIAVLIDLAQKGEIDPWDVQVIEVIDRFLLELGLNGNSPSSTQEPDLPQSGQAFLWASMLVLLKADTLERIESWESEATEIADLEAVESSSFNPSNSLPPRLEKHIRRRASAPPPKRRKVTLQELITQIQQIATDLESVPSRPKRYSCSRQETIRKITQLAHNENLSELASKLEQFLSYTLPQLAPENDSIDLEQLLEWWQQLSLTAKKIQQPQPQPPGKDKVGVFWALLLLSSQSKVELFQEEFYQDLRIKPIWEFSARPLEEQDRRKEDLTCLFHS